MKGEPMTEKPFLTVGWSMVGDRQAPCMCAPGMYEIRVATVCICRVLEDDSEGTPETREAATALRRSLTGGRDDGSPIIHTPPSVETVAHSFDGASYVREVYRLFAKGTPPWPTEVAAVFVDAIKDVLDGMGADAEVVGEIQHRKEPS